MITADAQTLGSRLASLPGNPRVVASGNHCVPWELVGLLDEQVETFTLNLLNGPAGLP